MKPIFTFPQPRRLAEQFFHLKTRITCPNKRSHRKHTQLPTGKTNAAITPMASSANEIRSPKVINFKPMLADAMTEHGIPEY